MTLQEVSNKIRFSGLGTCQFLEHLSNLKHFKNILWYPKRKKVVRSYKKCPLVTASMQHNVLFKKERTLEKSRKKINDKNLLQVCVICWNSRRGVSSKPNYILYRCVDVA